jgi:hypothetical protein
MFRERDILKGQIAFEGHCRLQSWTLVLGMWYLLCEDLQLLSSWFGLHYLYLGQNWSDTVISVESQNLRESTISSSREWRTSLEVQVEHCSSGWYLSMEKPCQSWFCPFQYITWDILNLTNSSSASCIHAYINYTGLATIQGVEDNFRRPSVYRFSLLHILAHSLNDHCCTFVWLERRCFTVWDLRK